MNNKGSSYEAGYAAGVAITNNPNMTVTEFGEKVGYPFTDVLEGDDDDVDGGGCENEGLISIFRILAAHMLKQVTDGIGGLYCALPDVPEKWTEGFADALRDFGHQEAPLFNT